MKAIILVAGYATRLYPLTLNKPKALLEVNGKPIIDYIVEQINTIDVVNEIYVVSNHKFADQFEQWAENHFSAQPICVLDDGTQTEQTRRGAIGDILFTIKQKNIMEDMLVVAGDNFFTYSLKDYYNFYRKMKHDCVCVKEFYDVELLKQFGVATLDKTGKIIDLEEKPQNPKSNTAVYATYFYTAQTVPMFEQYLKEGNKPDAPGYFIEWLFRKKDVYAYKFEGECYDIGTPKSYESICKMYETK